MQFQEEIYTSAVSLLEGRGGGNLGVVAKSRGFPREVEADMALLRGYTLLAELAVDNSEQHPPRLTITSHDGNQEWLCLSRVVFAGADHTGRTTPLAHHMAFEVEALKAHRVGAAALLSAAEPLFFQRWDEAPTWIEPLRTLANIGSPETTRQFPSTAWEELVDVQRRNTVLATAAEHLLRFTEAKKTVIVCLPIAASTKVPHLMADLLALLPEEVQLGLQCASHVIDPSDAPSNAALIFTYPGTRLLKQAQERRDARSPIIFDLTGPAIASATNGDYASVISPVLRSAKAATELPRVRELWHQLGIDPEHVGEFRRALLLLTRLQKLAAVDELDTVARQLAAVTAISASAGHCVEQWSLKYVLRAVERWSPADQKKALVAVATDSRWPAPLAQSARQRMRENAIEFVPYLLERALADAADQRTLAPLISDLLAGNQGIVAQLISKASAGTASRDKSIALAAVERCGEVDGAQLQIWLDAAITAADGSRCEFIAPILARLKVAAPNPAQNAKLRDHFRGRGDVERLFLGEVYLPLLRDSLERTRPRELWKAVASQLVEAALDAGSESDTLAALATTHRASIDGTLVDEWRRRASAEPAHDTHRSERLESALQCAGLARRVQLPDTTRLADGCHEDRAFLPRRVPRGHRHLQQPIGRAARITSILLAGLTVGLLALPGGLSAIPGKRELLLSTDPIKPLFWAAAGIIVACLLAECAVLFMRLRFSTARVVRAAILAMLITASLLSAYRLWKNLKPNVVKWPGQSAKR